MVILKHLTPPLPLPQSARPTHFFWNFTGWVPLLWLSLVHLGLWTLLLDCLYSIYWFKQKLTIFNGQDGDRSLCWLRVNFTTLPYTWHAKRFIAYLSQLVGIRSANRKWPRTSSGKLDHSFYYCCLWKSEECLAPPPPFPPPLNWQVRHTSIQTSLTVQLLLVQVSTPSCYSLLVTVGCGIVSHFVTNPCVAIFHPHCAVLNGLRSC